MALLITQQERDELQSIVGPEFTLPSHDDPSFIDKTVDVFGQLGTGFIEGYTTMHLKNEPLSKAGEIARGIGHLAGFIGFVPDPGDLLAAPTKAGLLWGTAGIKKAAAKRIMRKDGKAEDVIETLVKSGDIFKNAEKVAGRAGYGQAFGGLLHGSSVPMLGSSLILRTPAVKRTLSGVERLIAGSSMPGKAKDMLRSATYGAATLAPAMAISGAGVTPWDDRNFGERVEAGLQGFVAGAVLGGADGVIGNIGSAASALIAGGKPRSAEVLLKAFAGGIVNGMPSSLRGEDTADQVFNWLLGGYFGAKSHPWAVTAGAMASAMAMGENRAVLESHAKNKDWGRFIEHSGIGKIYEQDKAAGTIAFRELLERFDAPDDVIASALRDPYKFQKKSYDEYPEAKAIDEAVEATKLPDTPDLNDQVGGTTFSIDDMPWGLRFPAKLVKDTYDYVFTPKIDKAINFDTPDAHLIHKDVGSVADKAQKNHGFLGKQLEDVQMHGKFKVRKVAQSLMEPIDIGEGFSVAKWRAAIESDNFGAVSLTDKQQVVVNDMKKLFKGAAKLGNARGPQWEHVVEAKGEGGKWVEIERLESGTGFIPHTVDGKVRLNDDGTVRRFEDRPIEQINRATRTWGDGFFHILKHPGSGIYNAFRSALINLNKGIENPEESADLFLNSWAKKVGGKDADVEGGARHSSMEYIRELPIVGDTFTYNGVSYEIQISNPILYAETFTNRNAATTAFRERYGQGLKDVVREWIDDDGMEMREVVKSPDLWEKDVRGKLTKPEDIKDADEIQRLLNGLPLDTPIAEPGTDAYKAYLALKGFTGLYREVLLSGASIPNIIESITGNIPAFLGVKSSLRGAVKAVKEIDFLNYIGSLTKAHMNFLIDPNRPIRDRVRIARDLLRRGFVHHFINEWQERHAAGAALAKTEMWNAGKVSKYDEAFLKNTKMFTKEEIDILLMPKTQPTARQIEVQNKFVRSMPQYLTSAMLSTARASRAANTRLFGEVFPFMSYGMKKMETMRGTIEGVQRAYKEGKKGDSNGFSAAMKAMRSGEAYLLGRTLTSTAMQGAGAYLLLSLAFGGLTGLHAAISEAQDEPFEFLTESILYSTLTGPFAQLARYAQGGDEHPIMAMGKATFPGAIIDEIYTFTAGKGRYKDQTPLERVETFFTNRMPISGPVGTAMATIGLSDRDAGLEGSIKAYWRWRYDEFPPGQFNTGYMEEEQKKFRRYMRKAMHNIRQGKDPRALINNAIAVKDGNVNSARQSIRSRRLLADLKPEQAESLRKRIGEKAFEKLVAYDKVLTGWAESLGAK